MEKFIGIKFVEAEPMCAGEAIEKGYLRIGANDENPNPEEEGYHVHYTDNDYDSWCPKEVFEKNNNLVKNGMLAKSARFMVSADYKERFKAECMQLHNRLCGLKAMVAKWDKGELDFTPTCPREWYDKQIAAMSAYEDVLFLRDEAEGVEWYDHSGKCCNDGCAE